MNPNNPTQIDPNFLPFRPTRPKVTQIWASAANFNPTWTEMGQKWLTKYMLNEYETSPSFLQLLKPKLDIGLLVDLAEFPCFVPVLARRDHKIVFFLICRTILWSYHARTGTKQGNSARSTNNPMSSFGLIEWNFEPSHIY